MVDYKKFKVEYCLFITVGQKLHFKTPSVSLIFLSNHVKSTNEVIYNLNNSDDIYKSHFFLILGYC